MMSISSKKQPTPPVNASSANSELHRRHVRLECHSRRGNMKFFGIKERENEANNDTELALREFMRTKLKILPVDEENIHFDRVHRITSRRSQSNGRSL